MNKGYRHLALLASIVLVAAAVGCSSGQQRTESPTGEGQIATAVAQTLAAVPTATAPQVAGAPTDTPEPHPPDTPTPIPEPKPTDTPGPTNTPVPEEPTEVGVESTATPLPGEASEENTLIDALFEEAYFSPPAGGLGPEESAGLPPVDISFGHDDFVIITDQMDCRIRGFPLDERITVSFHASNGDLLFCGDFVMVVWDQVYGNVRQIYPEGIGRIVGSAVSRDEGSLIRIGVTWPATLPDEGYIRATSPSAYAEATFDLGIPGDEPRVSVMPKDWENGNGFFGRQPAFSPGDDVMILGTGFEPNSSVPLGIYQRVSMSSTLVLADIVNVDDQGRFIMRTRMDASDLSDEPIDLYHVLAVITAPEGRECPSEGDRTLDYGGCPIGPLGWFQVDVAEERGLTPFATSSASSYLATDSGEQYEPGLATDGALETAWVEGVPGPGVGEWFMLTFPGAVEIDLIDVDAGCDHNADSFYANNRIKRATLIFSGGEQIDVTLSDIKGMQTIALAHYAGSNIETTSVKLVIEEVYPGSEYDGTCLAEIAVWGTMR